MVRLESRLVALAASALAAFPAAAQVVGENVNMVSGTRWPGGDPFLQRQNEPTLAVSSVNPQHLLAAANDYRSVDLPNPNFGVKVNGDAWLGIFKSLDGGQTWKSVLLPGYPQDPGCASPAPPAPVGHVHTHRCGHTEPAPAQGGQFALCGMPAAADPVVRAGTDGMFYVGGINFLRDKSRSRLFLARYVDANNKENGDATKDGDPIRYVDTRLVAEAPAGVFIDKPWFAVDVPRAGAATCEIPLSDDPGGPKRTFLGGIIYAAWAEFVEPAETSSELKFSWSRDCGRTWVAPYRLNTANSILNQGVSIAIEPNSGRVYAAWRRFPSGKQGDAILVTRSEGRSKHFSAPRVISASMTPFEQFMDGATFRAEAFPTMAISTDGTRSWLHVGWSQKKASGDGRIFLSTAQVYPPPNGDQDLDEDEALDAETRLQWSTPAAVDDAPIADDAGHAFSRGHQAMPSLTFSQGRLVLVYYDTRLDHTRRYYRPRVPFAPTNGHYYEEVLAPLGELVGAGPGGIFAPTITDAGLTQVRRTVDVRVAVAGPGPVQAWRSVQANKFSFGLRGDEFSNGGQGLTVDSFDGAANRLTVVDGTGKVQLLQQLQHNPPNLPIFKNGTRPFMGDYIDVQGPAFVTSSEGAWVHNTAPTTAPVFHAVWTSNQDVKAPPVVNGQPDWAGYTPIGGGGASVYDPTVTTPACSAGYAGTRDQNIYTARITEGLAVSSPQNQKALSPTETRTFVVAAQNTTREPMTVDLVATPGDSPGLADFSFVNDLSPGGARSTALRGVVIPAHSTVVRTLFARSDSPSASIKVVAGETCPAAPCRSGFVTLNPPVALATLLQPDGQGPPLSAGEQYAIQIMAPNVTNPNVTNPNVTNPNVTNPNVTNPNVTNPNVTNPNVTNPNVTNPNVTNPNVTNAAVSDLSYTVANTGNTTTSYAIQIVKFEDGYQAPSPVQLIVSRTYYTPAADGCALKEVPHDQILVNVPDVSQALVSSRSVVDPNVTNPNVTNATLALPPGETAVITLRAFVTLPQMAALGAKLGPAAIPQSYRPQPGVTYENVASVLPGASVVVPGAASRTQLTYDRATGLASVQVRSASGTGATPGGQVYLIANDDWRVAAFTLDASGNGSATIAPALPVGTNLVAYYAGDAAYAGSVSGAVTVAVTGSATATFMAINYDVPSSTISVGRLVVLPAPWPTGTLTFYVNGSALPPVTMPASGPTTVTSPMPLSRGDVLTFSYSGDAYYAPRQGGPVTILGAAATVQPQAEVLASRIMVSVYGFGAGPVATGTVALSRGGVPYGTFPLFAGGAVIPVAGPAMARGETFQVTYSGDSIYDPAGPASTTAAGVPAAVQPQSDVLASRVMVSVYGFGAGPVSTGTVALSRGGVPYGTFPLVAGGAVIPITGPAMARGETFQVTYSGDSIYDPAGPASTTALGVPASVQITNSDVAGGYAFVVVSPFLLGGPAPSGTVTFSRNGVPLLDSTALSPGGSAQCAVPGISRTDLLVAQYAGDGIYDPATSAPFLVPGVPTQTTVTYDPATFIANVSVTSGSSLPSGAVDLYAGADPVAATTVTAGTGLAVIHSPPVGVGRSLVASYLGDSLYEPSSSAPVVMTGFASAPPMPAARKSHGTVAVGKAVYVFGGNGPTAVGNTMDAYDTLTGTWSARAPAPAPLSGAFGTAAAALGSKIYVFPPAAAVQVYDTLADSWTTLASLTPGTGSDARAVELDGAIYLFLLRVGAYRYDPAADAFTALTVGASSDQSSQFDIAVANGKVYLFPGVAPHGPGPFTPTLLEFDPAAGTGGAFTRLPVTFAEPINWGAAATLDGKIYALGGGAYVTNIGTVRVFDPVAQTLADYPVPRPAPTYGFGGAVVDGVFYLTGGGDDSAVAQPKVDAFYPAP